MNTIFFIAGNSGGHIIPLISYAKKIKDKKSNFFFITTDLELDKKIIHNEKLLFHKIFEMKLSKIPKWPKSWLLLIFDFFKTFYLLIKYKPDCIYTTGGYISIIFTLIAFFLRIPTYIFHLDLMPGKAGKLISIWVKENWIVFEKTRSYLKNKIIKKIDYPIKFSKNKFLKREEVCNKLNIPKESFIIFILGGSQGSEEINNLIYKFFKNSTEKDKFFCIHQAGKEYYKILNFYNNENIKNIVFDYNGDLFDFYSVSDLIISRAGAGSLFEIIFFNKKAIIIPLKNSAQNHQTLNCLELSKQNDNLKIILDHDEDVILEKMKKILFFFIFIICN